MNDDDWLEFDDEDGVGVPIELPADNGEFFARTAFKEWDLIVGIGKLSQNEKLTDDETDLLKAVSLALLGLHPMFRVKVDHPPEGQSFATVARARRHMLSMAIGEQIDLAVARGAKLEAEVAAACAEYGVSRREVFRFLSETRALRLQRVKFVEENEWDGPGWELPEGFALAPDGRIVPNG